MPGPSEWIVVAIVALVVIFGAKKIPEMARSMGRAQSEFKKGMKEGAADLDETPPAAAPPANTTPPPVVQPATPPPAAGQTSEPPAEPPQQQASS